MNVFVIFPNEPLLQEEIDLLVSRLKTKFDSKYSFRWIVHDSWMSHFSKLMPNLELELFSSKSSEYVYAT